MESNNQITTDKDGDKIETLDVAITKRLADISNMQKEIEKKKLREKRAKKKKR